MVIKMMKIVMLKNIIFSYIGGAQRDKENSKTFTLL